MTKSNEPIFEWSIHSPQVADIGGLKDVVVRVPFSVKATVGDESYTYVSSSAPGAASPDTYTSFDDLTEDMLKGWIIDNYPAGRDPEVIALARLNERLDRPVRKTKALTKK